MAIIFGGGRVFSAPNGGPYPPLTYPFGGFPTISTDIAIMSIFILFFFIGLILHGALLAASMLRRGGFVLHSLMSCRWKSI